MIFGYKFDYKFVEPWRVRTALTSSSGPDEFKRPWRVRAALILDVLTVAFSFYLWTIFIVGFLLIWNRIWIMIGWRWFWRWQRSWWKLRWWIWCRCLFWCYRWRIGWCYFRCLRLCCTMCAMSRDTWFNIWCNCSIRRCSSLQNTRCWCYCLARWWRSLCPRCWNRKMRRCRVLVKVLTEIDIPRWLQYINRLLNLNYGYWSFKAMVIYLNIAWDLYDVLKPRQLKPLFPAWFKPPIITKVIIINSGLFMENL